MSENTVFKNILVTGCCGFIGSNFVNYILSKYDDIFILNIDRLDYCANENNIEEKYRKSDRYRLVVADINNKEFILRCLSNYNIDTIMPLWDSLFNEINAKSNS